MVSENTEKVGRLIKGIRIAMLTTIGENGDLHSRPMANQETEFDGDLWFFTSKSSGKIESIRHDQNVNVAFVDQADNRYVSLSGKAQLITDQAKIKELWSPSLKAWFPDGLADPNLILLKVSAESAEYWDSPSSTLVQVVGFAKAVLTGEQLKTDNKRVNLH